MTTEQASAPTAIDDSLTNLEIALRDLGSAVKSLRLYPPTSQVVKGAIERSYRSFEPLLGGGYLRLEITPELVRVGDRDIGAGTGVEQLAGRMHRRGIAKLDFDGGLEPASLQTLAEIVASRQQAIDEAGGIEKMFASLQPRGVMAEFLQLARLFGDEEEDQEEEDDVWEAILQGYSIGANAADDIDWTALAQSIDGLTGFVEWLGANLDAVAERTGYENIDVMRFVLDRLGDISNSLTADHVDLLVLAVRQAFDQFDPEVLVELLADPVEIEVDDEDGHGVVDPISDAATEAPHRKTVDVGNYIACGLAPEQAERLILHTLRTRQRSTPRLYGLFERLTHDRPERDEMARHLEESFTEETAQGAERSQFLANWPRLFDVLNGESPQRFLSSEYETGLQQLLSPSDLANAWPIERVKPRLSEMAGSFIGVRKSLMVARLLGDEVDETRYQRLALELEGALPSLVLEGQFRTLHKLLKELFDVARDMDCSAPRREISAAIVERFYTAERVSVLLDASLGRPRDEAEIIIDVIRLRGVQATPLLLTVLADEQTRRGVRRRLLRLLTELGNEVGEMLIERFDDDRWFVLRNLAVILGEVGDPSMVEHLTPLVDHGDARVRREAITSAIKLGGPHAAPLLMRALADGDATVQLMAIHGLGYHHPDADGLSLLRQLLASRNYRGQQTNLIQVVAIALGRLRDAQSRSALKRLSRRPWYCRSLREPARRAAAWALESLDGQPARKAPEPVALVDLRPDAGSRRPKEA